MQTTMEKNGAQMVESHKEAIELIDDVLDVFHELREEMVSYEKKKNVAKTVGTSVGAVGAITGLAGIGLAAFTGGVSLLLTAGSIAGTLGGAGVNLVTDIVDHIESKDFFERIDRQLNRYNRQLEKLTKMWKEVEKLVNELVKQHDIDANTAMYVLLNLKSTLAKTAKNITAATNGAMLLQAAHVINTLKSVGTIIKTPTGGMQFILKTTELTAKQIKSMSKIVGSEAVRLAPSIGKSLLQGGLAIFTVAISVWEITTLIGDWKGNHPTIQAVDKVTRELRKKKQSLEDTVEDIQNLLNCQT